MKNFLIIKTADIPAWTKANVPTYSLARFNNEGSEIIIDNGHPLATYYKWLGGTPEVDTVLQDLLFNSVCVTAAEFAMMENDPLSKWFAERVSV